MPDYVTGKYVSGIRTSAGDLQIDYTKLANLPDIYEKKDILSPATRTSLGIDSSATPDNAFQAIKDELDSKAGIDKISELVSGVVYSKDDVLTNSIKSVFGLSDSAVPNDVFAMLGEYNKHWWKRRIYVNEPCWVENLIDISGIDVLNVSRNNSTWPATCSFQVSDSVAFYENGSPYLVNPTEFTLTVSSSGATNSNELKGKYLLGIKDVEDRVLYIGNNVEMVVHHIYTSEGDGNEQDTLYECYYSYGSVKEVSSIYYVDKTIGEWEYLTSTTGDRYRDHGLIASVGYKKSTEESNKAFLYFSGSDTQATINYSDEVYVDVDGNISLVSPQSVTFNPNDGYAILNYRLKGKFFVAHSHINSSDDVPYFAYMPTNAPDITKTRNSGTSIYVLKGTISTVTSDISYDGYEYKYLGIPLKNAATSCPKMELISYYGTALSGSEQYATSVTCSFAPDIWMHLGGTDHSGNYVHSGTICVSSIVPVIFTKGVGLGGNGNYSICYGKTSEDKKTLSWYTPTSEGQYNQEGYEYFVLAIRV